MTKELSVVLAGCGGMSRAWLGIAKKIEGLKLVGLTDLRREAAEKRAAEFELPPDIVFDTLKDALKKTKPDIVFDCTTPEGHYSVTMTALKAGCHVMGEKPLADSMEHARRMVAAARRAGRLYAVMQNRRYLPTAPALVKLLREGTIGDITTVNVDFYIGAHFGGFRDQMDHPLLLDMAIHTFDQARQITGADAVSVYCHEFNPKGSWYKGDASAMCVFQMTGGIVFNYRGSWCSEGYHTPWAGTWRIIGTKGTALWAEDAPRAEVVTGTEGFHREKKEIVSAEPPLQVTGHEACIREFIDCVRSGRRPQTSCEDNIKSLAMVFGAIKSNKAGRPVSIRIAP
jgi:predicted dehydrogenase